MVKKCLFHTLKHQLVCIWLDATRSETNKGKKTQDKTTLETSFCASSTRKAVEFASDLEVHKI